MSNRKFFLGIAVVITLFVIALVPMYLNHLKLSQESVEEPASFCTPINHELEACFSTIEEAEKCMQMQVDGDTNCDGTADEIECNSTSPDSDGDGICDKLDPVFTP